MFNLDPLSLEFRRVVNQASTARALTTEQADTVKAYIAANCDGMTVEQIVAALAMPYQVPNPEPQGLVPVATVKARDLWFKMDKVVLPDGNMLGALITKLALAFAGNAADDQAGAGAYRLYKSQFTADEIDLTLPDSKQIAALLSGKWGVPQDVLDSIFKVPDPSWVSMVDHVSPLEDMGMGAGAILDAVEVAGLVE